MKQELVHIGVLNIFIEQLRIRQYRFVSAYIPV